MDIISENISALSEQLLCSRKSTNRPLSLLPESINVMVVSKMIPAKELIRLQLPHRSTELSVCLLVKDTDKSDYNRSVDAWKLRWKTNAAKRQTPAPPPPTFLPLRELKLAYQPYASKQRLAATFDLFLADRRIVHHLPTKLGKAFYGCTRGKVPIPVTLTSCNLVDVIEKAQNTMIFQIRGLGTTESAPVGDLRLPLVQLKANISALCEKICNEWPGGGLANIRSLYLQSPGGNIPLFFDPTELPLEKIITESKLSVNRAVPTTHSESTPAPRSFTKRLSMDLLSRVATDLPLPTGGLEEVLAKAKKAHAPKSKRVRRTGKVRQLGKV